MIKMSYKREPIEQVIPKSSLVCESYREDQTDMCIRVKTEDEFNLLNHLMSHPLILNVIVVLDDGKGNATKHENHRLNRVIPTHLTPMGIRNLEKYL